MLKSRYLKSLGSPDPSKIVVTTGEDPSTSVGISWETSLDITQGNIVIGKQSDLSDGRTIAATNKTILTTLNSYDRNYQAWDVCKRFGTRYHYITIK